VIGGADSSGAPIGTAELYDPATDSYTDVADALPTPVSSHTATLLENGTVLVTGGVDSSGAPVAAAQLFDPETQTFAAIASMQTARVGHTATVLSDGRVLIAGGADASGPVASLEIFDPTTSAFSALAPGLGIARKDHTATLLSDKTVLIAGGSDGTNALASAEVFSPEDGTVTAVGSLATARSNASSAPLIDGSVIIIGGSDSAGADLDTAEIYNASAQTFSAVPSTLAAARSHHAGVSLPNNWSVLVAGGTSGGTAIDSAELYSPFAGVFQNLGPMSSPRGFFATNPLASVLSGLLLASGGADSSNAALGISESFSYPTITSDRDDYPPFSIATIVGTGWKPGETVDILIQESDGSPDTDLSVTASGSGIWSVEHDVGDNPDVRFMVTASGAESGWTAQRTFTDSPKVSAVSVGTQAPNPVTAGNSATYTVSVTRGSGSDSIAVTLTVSTALPAGTTVGFAPNPISWTGSTPNPQTSTLTIGTTCPTTPGGTTAFTVVGTRSDSASTSDTASGGGSLAVTACAAPVTKLVFSGGASGVTGQCIPVTVKSQNASSVDTNVTSNTAVALSSTVGTDGFFSDAACTAALPSSQVTIASGTSSAGFFFRPFTDGGALSRTITGTSAPLTSATQSENISKASTTTTVDQGTPSTSVIGQSYTAAWTVTVDSPGSLATALSGNVTVDDGNGNSCFAAIAVGSCSLTSTSAGSKTLTATYAGDANYNGSAGTNTHAVTKRVTTTAVGLAPMSVVVGQTSQATITVTDTSPGTTTDPNGPVPVTSDSGDTITGSPCTLVSQGGGVSKCTVDVTPVSASTHVITATFATTGIHLGSAGNANLTVNKADTTTSVVSDVNPSKFGQAVKFTATIAVTAPGTGTPTGSVQFFDGITSLGTVALTGLTAELTTSALTVGSHNITAKYLGDGGYDVSTSSVLVQVVDKADTTTTITNHTAPPTVVGQDIVVDVKVEALPPGAGTPTGNVTVGDGSVTCLATLSGGTGSCTLVPTSAGNKTLTAHYNSDDNFNPSDAAGVYHQVNTRATTTEVTLNPVTVFVNQPSTVTVKVSDIEGVGVKSFPTGTVAVTGTPNDVITGTCTLGITGTSGVSQCAATVTPSAASTHAIDAAFSVTSVHSASNGSAVLRVNKRPTEVTVGLNAPAVFVGETSTATIRVTDITGDVYAVDPIGTVDITKDVASDVLSAASCALVGGGSGSSSCQVMVTPQEASIHTISAEFHENGVHLGDTGSAGLTVNKRTTSTTVALIPPSVLVNGDSSVKVTVTDNTVPGTKFTPTGNVTVGSDVGSDVFTGMPCVLSPVVLGEASCMVTVTPAQLGIHVISATFLETNVHLGSGGSANLNVQCGFLGFQSPYQDAASGRTFKIKSAIPLKWQCIDAGGAVIPSPDANPLLSIKGPYSCGASDTGLDPIAVDDAGQSGLRYEADIMTWHFNWKTTGLKESCYNIYVGGFIPTGPYSIKLKK
jgi:hypothetical protein